jgi:hypothetical protein
MKSALIHTNTQKTKRHVLQNAIIIIIIFHMEHPFLKEMHIRLK